jgi:hypothetical protein
MSTIRGLVRALRVFDANIEAFSTDNVAAAALPVEVAILECEHDRPCTCAACDANDWCAAGSSCSLCGFIAALYGEPPGRGHVAVRRGAAQGAGGQGAAAARVASSSSSLAALSPPRLEEDDGVAAAAAAAAGEAAPSGVDESAST